MANKENIVEVQRIGHSFLQICDNIYLNLSKKIWFNLAYHNYQNGSSKSHHVLFLRKKSWTLIDIYDDNHGVIMLRSKQICMVIGIYLQVQSKWQQKQNSVA